MCTDFVKTPLVSTPTICYTAMRPMRRTLPDGSTRNQGMLHDRTGAKLAILTREGTGGQDTDSSKVCATAVRAWLYDTLFTHYIYIRECSLGVEQQTLRSNRHNMRLGLSQPMGIEQQTRIGCTRNVWPTMRHFDAIEALHTANCLPTHFS